jgi:branched-chain amino acid transport system substrate-binding protein
MNLVALNVARKRFGGIALIAVLALVTVGEVRPDIVQAQAGSKTFTFGAMFPLTGPGAEIGQEFQSGLDMAIEEINAKGGVDGWKLKSIVVDHKGTALGGAQAMNQLVNLDKVPFVITTFTGVALTAQPIAQQNQVVLFNVGGTSNNLLEKPWLYNDQVMGAPLNAPLAQYGYDNGGRTAALLTSEDAFGKDNGIAFTEAWTKLGGKIVASETFPLTAATDFTAQLTKIRAAKANVLYVVAVSDTQGLLVKQARALDIKSTMVGPFVTPGLIRLGGKAAEGFIGSGISVNPGTKDPAAKGFLDAYKAKYNRFPNWDEGIGFEAVKYLAVLIHDVTRSGADPRSGAALQKALEAHPSFQNYLSGGQVRFLKDHGSIRAVDLSEVRDGKFVTIKVVQPAK